MKRNFLTLGILSLALAACSGGENGLDGKDGKDGGSCHVADNGDGSATINCPDGSSFTVKNGENGLKGDAGSDGEKGQNGQSCNLVENDDGSQAVVCPADGSSYIVRGNTDNYSNYCAPGFYGKNCENECSCNEQQDCNDGVAGDGSCSCKNHLKTGEYCDQCKNTLMTGENCDQCKNGLEGENCDQCIDHNTYKTVVINEQTWMAENLKNRCVDHYSANGDSKNDDTYGYLYTWENAKKACPSGWRLPTVDEYLKLSGCTEYYSFYVTTAIQSTSWNSSASNSTGFDALPAGFWDGNGHFNSFNSYAYFWSATTIDYNFSYILSVESNLAGVDSIFVDNASSVRCLKD